MKALIFAAGLGTRLKPLTDNKPKALVEVYDEPLLAHVLRKLSLSGYTEVVINVHHFGEQIIDYIANHPIEGMKLYGGDLLLDDHKEITSLAGVRLEGNRLQLDGTLLSRLGTEKAAYHDLSDPGSVFQLIETGCQLDG